MMKPEDMIKVDKVCEKYTISKEIVLKLIDSVDLQDHFAIETYTMLLQSECDSLEENEMKQELRKLIKEIRSG